MEPCWRYSSTHAAKTARLGGRSVPGLLFAILLLAFFVLAPFSLAHAKTPKVRVAVAANFVAAARDLKQAFEAQSNYRVLVSSGATGALYAQITNGAPYDVFLAADQKRPILLEQAGKTVNGKRFTYAIGEIVLWGPDYPDISASVLTRSSVRRIAMANPKTAPYGAAAQSVLEALGVNNAVTEKKVIAQNIGQAFSYVATGNAQLGFIAVSQLRDLPQETRANIWIPDAELYLPIRQDAVLLKRAQSHQGAIAFVAFLQSGQAQAIIANHGYKSP